MKWTYVVSVLIATLLYFGGVHLLYESGLSKEGFRPMFGKIALYMSGAVIAMRHSWRK